MTEGPLVSILLSAYNYAHFLPTAIESALAQDYRPIEILLLDDASPDATPNVARRYSDRPELRYIRQPENLGTNRNINSGLELARGKYVILLSADDMLLPGALTQLVRCLETYPAVGAAFGATYHLSADGSQLTPRDGIAAAYRHQTNVFASLLSLGCFTCLSAVLVRRKLYDEFGPFAVDVTASDLDAMLRWGAGGVKFAHVDCAVCAFRLHDAQLSSPATYAKSGADPKEFAKFICEHVTAHTAPLIAGNEMQIERMLEWKHEVAVSAGYLDDGSLARALHNARERLHAAHEINAEREHVLARATDTLRLRSEMMRRDVPTIIVLATHSGSDTPIDTALSATLTSLRDQTCMQWQALVVTVDGDLDQREKSILTFDPTGRIRAIRMIGDTNLPLQLNTAIRLSEASSYSFVQSGDVLAPDYIATIAEILHESDAEMIIRTEGDTRIEDLRSLAIHPLFGIENLTIRKRLIDKTTLFPLGSSAFFDWQILTRAYFTGERMVCTDRLYLDASHRSALRIAELTSSELIAEALGFYTIFPIGDPQFAEKRAVYLEMLSSLGDADANALDTEQIMSRAQRIRRGGSLVEAGP